MSSGIISDLDAYLQAAGLIGEFTSADVAEFQRFLRDMSHTEGSAVELVLSSTLFDGSAMGRLMDENMITHWSQDESTGNYVIKSDKERMKRFSMKSLLHLRIMRAVTKPERTSWSSSPS